MDLNLGIGVEITVAIIVLIAFIVFLLMLKMSYTVVPPHQAHVVVSRGKGRKLFSSREGTKSSYWSVPIIQKRSVLPLRNKQLEIDDIPLRDKALAKFQCDVVCWINVTDPVLAAERIGSQKRIKDFQGIQDDITALVKSVTRNSSMKMDLVALMSEREKFSQIIEDDIKAQISGWGMTLIDLECVHFRDEAPYKVISDLEKRQAKQIEMTTRKLVADREKEASVAEAKATKETEMVKAQTEEEFKTRQILRDEKLGTKEQEKVMKIQESKQKANEQTVQANRTLTVGNAKVQKDATITQAEGEAEAVRTKGEADSKVIKLTGVAEADVVQAKLTAEATGIDRKAEAQKKYNESAMVVEVVTGVINAARDVQIAKFENLGKALEKASVNVVSSGETEIFGIPIGADFGATLGATFDSMKKSGFDVGEIFKDVAGMAKTVLKKEK